MTDLNCYCGKPVANFRAVKCEEHRGVCLIADCDRSSWQDTARTCDRLYCRTHRRRAATNDLDRPIALRDGSPRLKRDGYVYVYRNGVRIAEHRVVMEEKLGRPLVSGENIHHINLNRSDNRPENLELWVSSQPSGARVEDLLEWADEIIRRYR